MSKRLTGKFYNLIVVEESESILVVCTGSLVALNGWLDTVGCLRLAGSQTSVGMPRYFFAVLTQSSAQYKVTFSYLSVLEIEIGHAVGTWFGSAWPHHRFGIPTCVSFDSVYAGPKGWGAKVSPKEHGEPKVFNVRAYIS